MRYDDAGLGIQKPVLPHRNVGPGGGTPLKGWTGTGSSKMVRHQEDELCRC
jgi:hypothetical protein